MVSSLMVVSLVGVTASGGAGPAGGSPLIDEAKLQAAGMFSYWEARLPIAPNDSLAEGHLVDEALYVITEGGSVFALKADVGLLRWGAKLTEPDYHIYRPAHIRRADAAGPVVIPTTTRVFIYDRFSGACVQSFRPPFAAGSPAVALDDMLFMGSADGRFYSLQVSYPLGWAPFKRWAVLAGGPVTAAPLLYDEDMLLFASQGGKVYSCRAADKALNWAFTAGEPILGDPAVDERGVYVASTDRSLYKLRLGDGTVIWRLRLPRPLVEGPVVTAHTVYQYCPGHGLSAIDADTGRERWRNPHGRAFVAHCPSGDVVWSIGMKPVPQTLQVVDHETGDVRHTIDAQTVVKTVSNPHDDALYLLGRKGRILCARLSSLPYLRRQQVTAARARLNLPPLEHAETARRAREAATEETDRSMSDPLRSRRDVKP